MRFFEPSNRHRNRLIVTNLRIVLVTYEQRGWYYRRSIPLRAIEEVKYTPHDNHQAANSKVSVIFLTKSGSEQITFDGRYDYMMAADKISAAVTAQAI